MELEELRTELDALNEEIVCLLAKRRQVTKQVAQLKKREKLPVFDGNREKLQSEKVRGMARKFGIDPDVVEKLFEIYVAYCRQEMSKEMKLA